MHESGHYSIPANRILFLFCDYAPVIEGERHQQASLALVSCSMLIPALKGLHSVALGEAQGPKDLNDPSPVRARFAYSTGENPVPMLSGLALYYFQ